VPFEVSARAVAKSRAEMRFFPSGWTFPISSVLRWPRDIADCPAIAKFASAKLLISLLCGVISTCVLVMNEGARQLKPRRRFADLCGGCGKNSMRPSRVEESASRVPRVRRCGFGLIELPSNPRRFLLISPRALRGAAEPELPAVSRLDGKLFLQQDVTGIEAGVNSDGVFPVTDPRAQWPLYGRGTRYFGRQRSIPIDVSHAVSFPHPLRMIRRIPTTTMPADAGRKLC